MIEIKVRINEDDEEINLLNDFLFSKLFGERGCEEATLHLINTFTEKNFKNLSYEPNEMKGKYKGNKKSNVDVLLLMNDGSIVNVESQIRKQTNFHKRSHFYSSKIHSLFLNVGQNYENLPMTIMINFLGFNFHKTEDYHSIFILCDKKYREYAIEDVLETHYIVLPKFRKKLKQGSIDLNDPKDRIMLLLNKDTPQDLIEKVIEMDEFANNLYKKTLHVLQNRSQYLAYIRAEQAELDHKGMIKYAEEKGEKIGVKRGEEIGIKKGKIEEKIEIAIKLKKLDFPVKKIAEITGISVKKIKEL